jgi:2-hydroxychromene-2-carboxylate isomerase
MKRTILAAIILAIPLITQAAEVSPALRQYIEKSMMACPGSKLTIGPITGDGPEGFVSYRVTQTSSESMCGKATGAFFSPSTGQVMMADIFELPIDPRPIETRIEELSQGLLKQPVKVTMDPSSALPDKLWPVHIAKTTAYGPFYYNGYVDGGRRFLMVGRRGKIDVDPGKSLQEAIRTDRGVTRGSPTARVRVVELSDFECPTCKHAHEKLEPYFKANLSRISFTRLDLPLFDHHEWALQAALGARAIQKVAPEKYWSYVDFMFGNQEQIKKDTIDSVVRDFCDDHDIDWKKVETLYRSPQERTDLLAQVSRAFDVGVNGTPTYIVDGRFIFYGSDGVYLRSVLDSKLSSVPTKKAAAKPAKKKK